MSGSGITKNSAALTTFFDEAKAKDFAAKAKDLHELRSMINELQAEADTIEDEFKALMEAIGMGFPMSEESLHALAADRGLTVMDFVTEMEKVVADREAAAKRKEEAMKVEAELNPPAAGPGAKPTAPAKKPPAPAKKSAGKK